MSLEGPFRSAIPSKLSSKSVEIMNLFSRLLMLAVIVSLSQASQAQEAPARGQAGGAAETQEKTETVFSGPQSGEPLPEVPVWVMQRGAEPSKKVDLASLSTEAPIAIVFMHEKSRPAFGLARMMSEFAAMRKDDKLQLVFVILTEDRSSSEKWLGQIRQYFKPPTELGVAEGGIEGPGALGLNRLVAMTVLIAKEKKVLSNFAFTQISNASDAPKVLAAMNEAMGGGEVPAISELMPQRRRP